MASPKIQFKRGNTRPSSLNAGEPAVSLVNDGYSFYIGNNSGTAITFGAEVSIATDLGGSSTSDFKIPTQKAVKTYVDTAVASSSSALIYSAYSAANLFVGAGAIEIIKFATIDFQTPTNSLSLMGLSYNDSSGQFNFTGGTARTYFLINYQITWQALSNSSTYANREIIRTSWIQKETNTSGGSDDPQNRYGVSTIIVPPLGGSSAGVTTTSQSGSAIIFLDPQTPQQTFTIRARNHAASNQNVVATSTYINNSNSLITLSNRATRVQIIKL